MHAELLSIACEKTDATVWADSQMCMTTTALLLLNMDRVPGGGVNVHFNDFFKSEYCFELWDFADVVYAQTATLHTN